MTDQFEIDWTAPMAQAAPAKPTKADKQAERLARLKLRKGKLKAPAYLPDNVVSIVAVRADRARAEKERADTRARFWAWYRGEANTFDKQA
jgi:hypothetical protein